METKLRSEERKQYVLAKALFLGLQALDSVDNLMHREPSDIHDIKVAIDELGLDWAMPIVALNYTKAKATLDWSELDKEIEGRKQGTSDRIPNHPSHHPDDKWFHVNHKVVKDVT